METSRIMNDIQRTVRLLLKERGLSLAELAALAGLSVVSVQNLLHGLVQAPRRAWKIERVLGVAIWTPASRFIAFRHCSELLGADVVLTGFHELRRRAIARRIPNARLLTNRDDLVSVVMEHVRKSSDTTVSNFVQQTIPQAEGKTASSHES